jgi:hypothetical protein
MTMRYPLQYGVARPERFSRVQLAMRLVAFVALGMLGLSFGAILLFAYLALPVLAVSRLSSGRTKEAYVREDGPRILLLLHWLAAIMAWAGLISDRLPVQAPSETVSLSLERPASPGVTSAAWRVIGGLPSALVLVLLGWLGILVWLWAALGVLFTERVGAAPFGYLVGLQRYSLRLLAYQASLVDEYPPLSLDDPPVDVDVLNPAR